MSATIESYRTLSERLDSSKLRKCADMLKAIAHPIRMSILDLLDDGRRLTVTEIYERLELEQAVASHHLGILRDKGLVVGDREGKNTYYSLCQAEVTKVIQCIERCNTQMP